MDRKLKYILLFSFFIILATGMIIVFSNDDTEFEFNDISSMVFGVEEFSTEELDLEDFQKIDITREYNETMDKYKSYSVGDRLLTIEDRKYKTLVKLKLLSNYKNNVPSGIDTKVAEFLLVDFYNSDDYLFESLVFYNIKDNYKTKTKNFKLKYGIDYTVEKSLNKTTYNITETDWIEFTRLNELPSKNIKIGIFTNTILGEEIEWVPTIEGFEIKEWASFLVTNLEAYWNLDESSGDAIDSLGVNNGTVTGATPNQAGIIETSYSFTGGNDWIEFDDFLTGNNFSVSAWIYHTSTGLTQTQTILQERMSSGGEDGFWGLSASGKPYLIIWQSDGTGISTVTTTETALLVDTWYHYVAVANGTDIMVYVNGSQYGTMVAYDGTIGNAGIDYVWMGTNQESGFFWDGKIDEVGIWSRALNQTDIDELYNNGAGRTYPFEEEVDSYILNITNPTTADPESVSSEDNISINFDFKVDGVNQTSGVTINNITIDGNLSTILGTPGEIGLEVIDFSSFETDFDGWTDGGMDAVRTQTQANCGTWSVALDDNSGDGRIYKDFDLTGKPYALVNFSWRSEGAIDENECLVLSCDGTEIGSWGTDSDTSHCATNLAEDTWFDLSANITTGDCTFGAANTIQFISTASNNGEEFWVDCINITSFSASASSQQFAYIADTGWQVNVTVPSGSTGLVDLFLNATFDGNTRNDTQTNAIDYGGEGDTCTYVSGDWNVDCSDNCIISSPVDLGGNDISITGTGTFFTDSDISNYGRLFIRGTDSSNICRVTCSGGCFQQ